jgi:hypothetical protein
MGQFELCLTLADGSQRTKETVEFIFCGFHRAQ